MGEVWYEGRSLQYVEDEDLFRMSLWKGSSVFVDDHDQAMFGEKCQRLSSVL